ncbi:FKBP-type peptidyl-prolyl cis-trans isomerase [Roseivirga sp.]|uniref:FKBP-type peptidyl-prolyl cis-trans isomerase n=1 Tax=Roseivirga sp. TaxID=1964215 RepID=UPI002B2734E8|nr:FKBP-type peptidyl-prolyl cis-trans isomerase [Roseivirga sp.]
MKNILSIGLVILLATAIGCSNDNTSTAQMKTPQDSLSYAYGVQIAEMLKQQNITLDADMVAAAVREALSDTAQMTLDQSQEILIADQQRSMEGAKEEGELFLAENATKAGVQTTATGLQYKVVQEGTGASPKAEDTVTIHYTGKLLDGTVFDSSVGGDPLTYPVNQFIAGWIEGLQLMKIGGKVELYIPSDLAYGERGISGAIPPYAALIFEIELLEIK